MAKILPCSKKPGWDWKKGDSYISTVGDQSFERTYFDCGEYFWDGEFNVVRFPKDMSLYHGSAKLANVGVEFPVGEDFYQAVPFGTTVPRIRRRDAARNDNIPYQVSKFIPVDAAYFADPETAKLYSKDKRGFGGICGDRCLYAYKLRKETVFYLLDDSYNIAKLFSSFDVPDDVKQNLVNMFGIKDFDVKRMRSENPLQRFSLDITRKSVFEWDLPFAKWMCKNILTKNEYAGMAAPKQVDQAGKKVFHQEFVFCNATKYLQRDLSSEVDWQHTSSITPPSETNKLLETYKRFKSTNINTHGGNLYEHTVWTLLFYEKFVETTDIPKEFKFLGAMASFLHDIGKMAVAEELNKEIFPTTHSNFVYYAVPQHPLYGYQMLIKEKNLSTWPASFDPRNPKPSEPIDLTQIIAENLQLNGFTPDDAQMEKAIKILAFLVLYHWDFGDNVVRKINDGILSYDDAMQNFILGKWKDYNDMFGGAKDLTFFKNLLRVLIFMSAADVAGFAAYGKGRIAEGKLENVRSKFFPFIKNVPQNYRGSTLFETSNFKAFADELAESVKGVTLS